MQQIKVDILAHTQGGREANNRTRRFHKISEVYRVEMAEPQKPRPLDTLTFPCIKPLSLPVYVLLLQMDSQKHKPWIQ
jgi:hypothetical protein